MTRLTASRLVALLVALLVLLPVLPVAALHTPPPPPTPQVPDVLPDPRTGFMVVDDELDALRERHRTIVDGFNREVEALWGTLEDPPHPAGVVDLLVDEFTNGSRRGGLGDWSMGDEGWTLLSPTPGNGTMAFTDPNGTGYPTGASALLLSPEINLATLGGLRNAAPYERDDPNNEQDLFTLLLDHRFAFAADPLAGGFDGGRVEVFTGPVEPGERGEIIHPIGGGYDHVASFDGPGFTGTDEGRADAFDLTPWAGLKIRIGFRVSTLALGQEDDYFADRELFPGDDPPGWFLNRVEIRAPALPQRLVVGDLLEPRVLRYEQGIPEPAPGNVRFRVPIWNLGSENITAQIEWYINRDTSTGTRASSKTVEIPGGSVHVLAVNSLIRPASDAEDQILWFNVSASPPDPERLLSSTERFFGLSASHRSFAARVHTVSDVRSNLSIAPVLAQPGEAREAVVSLENAGNHREWVVVRLLTTKRMEVEGPEVRTLWMDPGAREELHFPLRVPDDRTTSVAVEVEWRDEAEDRNRTREHTQVLHSGTTRPKLLSVIPEAFDCPPGGPSNVTCEPRGVLVGSDDGRFWTTKTQLTKLEGRYPGRSPETPGTDEGADAPRSPIPSAYEGLIAGYQNLSLDLRYTSPPENLEIRIPVVPLSKSECGGVGELICGLIRPVLATARERLQTVSFSFPPDDGMTDGALASSLRNTWHEARIDLDEKLRQATGLQDTWNLGLQRLVFVTHSKSLVRLDHVRLSGVPVDQPDLGRVTLLETSGDPANETGEWTSADVTSTPVPSGSWSRTTEGAWSTAGWRWNPDAGAWHHPWQSDAARFYLPNVNLTATDPALALDHRYATSPEDFSSERRLRLHEVYGLQVQYLQEDGNWSRMYWVQPEQGYPRPFSTLPGSAREVVGGLDPGDGFYHPDGPVPVPDARTERTLLATPNGSDRRVDVFPLSPENLGGLDLRSKTVRFALTVVCEVTCEGEAADAGLGWWVYGADVFDRPLSHNVRLGNLTLDPPYDLEELGALGPGSAVPIRVQVNNTGFYDAEAVEVEVEITDDEGHREVLRDEISLLAGAGRTVSFLWRVPEDANNREIHVNATVELDRGRDQLPADDHEGIGPFRVDRVVDLRVRAGLAPRDAPVGVPRSATVEVMNQGNAPIEEVEVRRTIDRIAGAIVRVREDRWTLDAPVPPTGTWIRVDDPALRAHYVPPDPGAPEVTWTPTDPGPHVLAVQATSPQEPAHVRANNHRQLRDEVLSVTFSDGFEGDRSGGAGPYRFAGGDLWAQRDGEGFRSSHSLWVGGPDDGYPDGADASVELPEVDLTQARAASLSFVTRYALEEGYDGGVVEASVDGGRTWHPLTPSHVGETRGYPGPVTGANPVVPGSDPTRSTGAFTGTSPAAEERDGWVPVTVPLDQVPGFVESTTLADLLPPRPPEANESLVREGAAYYRPSWITGEAARLERFEVQNLTVAQPRPPAGGTMWYSGTQGTLDLIVDTTLNLTLADHPGGEELLVQFWDWRSGTTDPDREGTGGVFHLEAHNSTGEPLPTTVEVARDELDRPVTRGPWTLRNITIDPPADAGPILYLHFHYTSDPNEGNWFSTGGYGVTHNIRHVPGPTENRGWAVDNVTAYTRGSGGDDLVLLRSDIPEADDAWSAVRASSEDIANVTWSPVASIEEYAPPDPAMAAVSPGGWRAGQEAQAPVWELSPRGGDELGLAANLDTRLATPVVDLGVVNAETATLLVEHKWNFETDVQVEPTQIPRVNGGSVEIQVFNETTGSFDPWETLLPEPIDPSTLVFTRKHLGDEYYRNTAIFPLKEALEEKITKALAPYTIAVRGMGHSIPPETATQWIGIPGLRNCKVICDGNPFTTGGTLDEQGLVNASFLITGSSDWRTDRFDLSQFVGKRVRLGLHAWNDPDPPKADAREPETWTVRELRVTSPLFEGGPLQLRLRLGSDGSVGGEGWGVDDVRIGQAPYERNLALRFNRSLVTPAVLPEGTFWVNGTVENRGQAPRTGFGVRLTDPDGIEEMEIRSLHDDGLREGPAGPFALAAGGEAGSTAPFAFRVRVSEETDGELDQPVGFTLRLVEAAKPDARLLFDQVAKGKTATFSVNVTSSPSLNTSVQATPLRALPGDAVTVRPLVENTGPVPLEPRVWTNVTRDGEFVHSSQKQLQLARGERARTPVVLTPVKNGTYLVNVEAVDGATTATNETVFHIGTSFNVHGSDMEDDGLGQLRPVVIPGSETCEEMNGQRPPKAPHQWSRSNASAFRGNASTLFGKPPGQGAYQPFSDAGLQTQPLDAFGLPWVGLSFVHQPHFGEGHGAVVEMRLVDQATGNPIEHLKDSKANCDRHETGRPNAEGWFLLQPQNGYDSRTESTGDLTISSMGPPPPPIPGHFSPLGDDHPVLAGDTNLWRRVFVDLRDQRLEAPNGEPVSNETLERANAEFRLRATTQAQEATGAGWFVDDLAVSGHGVVLDPGAEELPLTDGARKVYTFAVENPSPYDDRYRVSVDPSSTTAPLDLVDLLTPTIPVPAGDTGVARVTVTLPVDDPVPSGEYLLGLKATSLADPLVTDTARLILDVTTVPHPQLTGKLELGGTRFEVGSTATLGAVVVNAGEAPSPSTTARFVVARPDGSGREVVGQVPVPPLPPAGPDRASQAIVSTNWTVPRTELGTYIVTLVIDPSNRSIELDEGDNTDTRVVEVTPLQRPDLQVLPTDVEILDLAGNELTSARASDLVQIVGTVRNVGNQPAPDTRVNVFVGASLADQARVGTLPPGGEQRVHTTVFAPANTTQVRLAARTASVELREDNNQAGTTLLVASDRVTALLSRTNLTLQPSQPPESVALTLVNKGTSALLASVEALTGPLDVEAVPETVAIPPGGSQRIQLTLGAGPETPAGEHEVLLGIRRPDGGVQGIEPITITVPTVVRHTVEPLDAAVQPGPGRLPVHILNQGNVEDEIRLSVRPAPWNLDPPTQLRLAPGEAVWTSVGLSLPNATTPGAHPLELQIESREGYNETVPVRIQVEPVARVTLDATPLRAGGEAVVYNVTVENSGNVPAKPLLSPPTQLAGWRVDLGVPARELAPGEQAAGHMELQPTGEPSPGILRFPLHLELISLAQPTRATFKTLDTVVDVRPPSLTVEDVARSPRFDVTAGEEVRFSASVENEGSGPAAPVDVWLYVDDVLVDHARIESLEAHSGTRVNLTYHAGPGRHAVVVSVDPQGLVAEYEEEDNQAAFVLEVSDARLGWLRSLPAPGAWLVPLLALCALAWRRRER